MLSKKYYQRKMEKNELKNLVERTLTALDLYSEDAVNLILGTIAQESAFGKYTRQIGGGPALGICQMEPATFRDIVNNYLKYKPDLAKKVMSVSGVNSLRSDYLEFNNVLAIAMCRVHYLRVPKGIPEKLSGWAEYWKEYYNTRLGKGTPEEFIKNYQKYVAI